MSLSSMRTATLAAALTAALTACGGSDAAPADQHIHLQFKAKVGAAAFSCGPTFTGLGAAGDQTFTAKDFRLYVHDVRLVTAAGAETPVTLIDGAPWQRAGVALLDFEDASGACAATGTAATNTELHAMAPPGSYTGLRFKVGVPEALNHLDVATAAAPLDLSALYWSWTGGYKFMRIDGTTTGLPTGINFHLGSTGCTVATPGDFSTVTCTTPNRLEISLSGFDHATSSVVLDAAALLSGSNLDADGGGAPGCMSGPTDPECAPIFARIGLPFGGVAAGAQSIFSVE